MSDMLLRQSSDRRGICLLLGDAYLKLSTNTDENNDNNDSIYGVLTLHSTKGFHVK